MKITQGMRFSRLLVLGRGKRHLSKDGSRYRARVKCLCDCGATVNIIPANLLSKNSRSCGCVKLIHGHARKIKSREYRTHYNMIQRCTNPNRKAWMNYGGRGITVCNRWKNFMNFLEDMGPKPIGLTLDRIDNEKGYYKENCRWADWRTQANNKRTRKKNK